MFKIPSIALTGAGSSRDSLLFALHSSNNSVTFHVKTTSGWQSMQGANEPILPQAPAPGSALAATSWIDGGWDEIRFYYISDNIEIMELSGSCSSATVCDWSSGRVILDSGVSTTSGLAVMHWGNSTVANKIVLLFVTSEDTLGQLTYDGLNWSYGISVSVGVAAGSGLTAVILGDDDPVLRAYWIEVSGGTNGLSAAPTGTTVPWTVSSDVPYSFSANLTPKAELASCMYPSQDLSIDYLALFQISTTGDVVEMVKQAGVGVWAPATSSFDQAEDAGGAIGCDGWSDDDDLQNLLVVYATGGLVTEYLLHDGSWSNATIFEE
ncbi:hypothetical protein LTR99_006516 [Exophiala xenobiotica]|nr:hypothetical protein LTR92_008079 [Exophiala xenobiotica]KAK5535624.1 hypothetical protein LTR23_008218 [Chaetothyriales sp. CCFEE 6169]KAK5219102.1 hypothetical protein LTR72_008284 [Exophiala xenobiotica]KAK5235405.1 hypothetical protein LTR47_003590 [Exophiala xenobiotica]KAK5250088.1 hypothetical protein LTS06_005149 [Exophiala xenobiotica]